MLLQAGDFLTCLEQKADERENALQEKAYGKALLFDEHTWGWVSSVRQPEHEMTYAQLNHKKEFAYAAAELAAYLVGTKMERLAENPYQSDLQEGMVLVNPVGAPMQCEVEIPEAVQPGRRLASSRTAGYTPYVGEMDKRTGAAVKTVEMPPFSVKFIPYKDLCRQEESQEQITVLENRKIHTPFYEVELCESNGRILQITEKKSGRKMLQENALWGLFDVVEESVDERFAAPERGSIYPLDVQKRNQSITTWRHDWRAVREGIKKFDGFRIEEGAGSVSLYYYAQSKSMKDIEQRIRFSALHPRIELDICFRKEKTSSPEGIYVTFPLKLLQGWECIYDTADTFVKLDEEQLGNVCRDYLTVDKSVSLFDAAGGYTLACPDAPMVQVGGFQFAKENRGIERNENPLLLAWPMNNYWDTNFAPSQDGMMCFHYELSCFAAFDAREAYRLGMQAAKPCVTGAAIECKTERIQEMLQCESQTSIPIFVRPQYKQDGWLVAVRNFSRREGKYTIGIPQKSIAGVYVTDIEGQVKQELETDRHTFCGVQPPNAITFLKVCFHESEMRSRDGEGKGSCGKPAGSGGA